MMGMFIRDIYGESYPLLIKNQEFILTELKKENDIQHFKNTFFSADYTAVPTLSAHCGIKRSFPHKDRSGTGIPHFIFMIPLVSRWS